MASRAFVDCGAHFSLSPTNMSAPSTPKHQETELEHETCIFDTTEVAINEAVLAQALAAQVAEQV